MVRGQRRVMVLSRRAPHGASHAREALELVLAAAGYEVALSFAFVDDGIWQLKRNQAVDAAGLEPFQATFGALSDFGVEDVFVERESMRRRGLELSDLLLPVKPLSSSALRDIMGRQHMLLSF